jgi:hypothetical protein
MAFKTTIQTPIQSYDIVFGKRNEEYTLDIIGKNQTKSIKSDKEFALKTYKKFLSSIGFGSSFSDKYAQFEGDKRLALVKIFKEGE